MSKPNVMCGGDTSNLYSVRLLKAATVESIKELGGASKCIYAQKRKNISIVKSTMAILHMFGRVFIS